MDPHPVSPRRSAPPPFRKSGIFELRDLRRTFAVPGHTVQALDGVSLDILPGEILGIIGASGSGKSTLLRTLNLLERPDSGTVTFDGQALTTLDRRGLSRIRRRIGMIFQHFHLLDARTVAGNIAFPLEIAGQAPHQIQARVAELARLVGLEDKLAAHPGQLSGGQKQRVAIARALASGPDVLLSDEATSALDPGTTVAILQLLKRLNTETGLTLVLVTHELEVIQALCHRVAVMEQGRLVEVGPVAQVLGSPRSRTARTLVALAQDLRSGTLSGDGDGI